MNYKMIFFMLGKTLWIMAFFFLLPLVCAAIYSESLLPFAIPLLLCLAAGFLFTFRPPRNRQLLAREGFVSVALCWITVSVIGSIPFMVSGEVPSFINALFESVSGFTTTGATVISDVESLSKSILLWRSFSHWIGGMGVIVFLLAIMPRADIQNSRTMHIMRAEVPGLTVEKIVPKIADTARIMYGIYILLTLLEFLFLLFGDMNIFESLNYALATAGTGGFGIRNDSLASFSPYSQYIVATFMTLFAINFNLYFLLLTGHLLRAFKSEEFWWFVGIVSTAITIIGISTASNYNTTEETFRHSFFQVASIISTTGFSTVDIGIWPVLALAVIILLMFSGGSSGCTAGGIKISRLLLLFKNAKREIKYILHPRAILSVKIDGRKIEHETIRGATSYIIIYSIILLSSFFAIILFDGADLLTGFTSVLTTLNNVGPALSETGSISTFADFSVFSKLVFCFDMLIGRLEIFPMLMLFSPSIWKKVA